MATGRNGELGDWLPSLVGSLSESEATMDLTAGGLLVDRTYELAELYAEHLDWGTVEEKWYEERVAERSSRESSRRIFPLLKGRLQAGGEGLPSVAQLPQLLDQCRNEREQAQLVYLYLLNYDGLARYVIHEYLRRLVKQGSSALDFQMKTALDILDSFRDKSGDPLDRSQSTQERWVQGIRSVMREIGVIDGKTSTDGQPPKVGDIPLQVGAYYSWIQNDDEWLTKPIGWLYLFQSEEYWEPQSKRLAQYDAWTHHEARSRVWFEPVDNFYETLAEGSV